MRIGRDVMLVTAVLAAAGIWSDTSSSALHAQDSQPAQVTGTVIDVSSKEPIAGVNVRLLLHHREQSAAVTDAAGRFTLQKIASGLYSLSASHSDYTAGVETGSVRSTRVIDLAPGEVVTDVTLGLGRRPVVSGTIRDEAGEPIVGAEVRTLLRNGAGLRALQALGLGRTDDRGAYRISLSRPGEYLVMANRPPEPFTPPTAPRAAPGVLYPTVFYPAAPHPSGAVGLTIGLGEQRTGIDLPLTPVRGRTVSGTLGGEPGSGRMVELQLVPTDGADVQWDLVLTSSRTLMGGPFSFTNVPPGTYMVSAVSYPRHTDRVNRVMRQRPWSHGGFSMLGWRPGEATGPPPAAQTLWAQQPVTVGTEDVTNLSVPLQIGARVRGRAVFEGSAPNPAEGELRAAWVLVLPADGRLIDGMPISGPDANGRFETAGLPPGDYQVSLMFETPVWRPRSWTVAGRHLDEQRIPIGSSDIDDFLQTFTDRRTVLSGIATDRTGRPFADNSVVVFPADRATWRSEPPGSVTIGTSQRGTFETLWAGGAGEYFVAGLPAAFNGRSSDPDILERLSQSATRVRVDEGQSVRVTVTVDER